MPKKDKSIASSSTVAESENIPENRSVDVEEESISTDTPGVIVIHPGSHTLRLGFSTQLDPHSIPHVIAYRTTKTPPTHCPSICILKHPSPITAKMMRERDNRTRDIIDTVTEARASHGIFDADSDVVQYGALNEQSQVVDCTLDDDIMFQWTDLSSNPQYVIGNEVLQLNPNSPYLIHKPLRRGSLNTSDSISRFAVLKQLEDLWSRAIEECLDIPKKEFKFYRVIICAPDTIDRNLYKDFLDILLNQLSFEAAIIHQESVCTTYGAGLSTACVVDVGEERTHICCVEDGMSNLNTRLTLSYGGNDITRFFHWLLQRASFPYKECSDEMLLDGQIVVKLKEKYCHFDMTVWGVAEEEVFIPHLGKRGKKFTVHFADELVYAPMGMYYPKVFCLSGKDRPLMEGQLPQNVLLEDIYDEANWGSDQNTLLKGSASNAAKNGTTDSIPVNEACKRLKSFDVTKDLMALDEAIHFSIDCTSSVEMKKKLYGSILLVGGGMSFSHSANLLQARLQESLPSTLKGSDITEVSSNPRDLSPGNVAWRGGAVLGTLDCCSELWIEKQEWVLFGVRLLRERSLFVW